MNVSIDKHSMNEWKILGKDNDSKKIQVETNITYGMGWCKKVIIFSFVYSLVCVYLIFWSIFLFNIL